MGYASDLGTGVVASIDPVTGYPMDQWGRLLQTTDPHDGSVIPNWGNPGTKLPNFTRPYGHLFYVCGGKDDFICFDFARVNAGPRGVFAVLHSVINSETGGFIQDGEYLVLPCNTMADQREVVRETVFLVDGAYTWVQENGLRHNVTGWNQTWDYFAISVAEDLFPHRFKRHGRTLNLRRNNRAAAKVAHEIAHGER